MGAIEGANFGANLAMGGISAGLDGIASFADAPRGAPQVLQEFAKSPDFMKDSIEGERYRTAAALSLLNEDQLRQVRAAIGDRIEYTFYGGKGEGLAPTQKRRLDRTLTNQIFSQLLAESGYHDFPNILLNKETKEAQIEGKRLFKQFTGSVSRGEVKYGLFSRELLDPIRERPNWYSRFLDHAEL